MKKLLFTTFLLLFAFASFSKEKIHLIQILATGDIDATIRDAANSVSQDVLNFAKQSSKALSYELNEIRLDGDKFNKANVQDLISKLNCEEDIVILTYVGHGFRSIKEVRDDLPQLKLNYTPKDYTRANTIFLSDILYDLYSKKPKFVLSMINSCNDVPNIDKTNNPYSKHTPRTEFEYVRSVAAGETAFGSNERYFDLLKNDLVNTTKSVTLLSCEKGQKSWLNDEGGFFHQLLMKSLQDNLQSDKKITWKQIGDQARTETIQWTERTNQKQGTGIEQYPTYEIFNVQGRKFSSITSPSPYGGNITTNTAIAPFSSNVVDYYNPYKKINLNYAIRLTKLSNTYREMKCYDCALNALDKAIPVLNKNGSLYFEATAYENKGWLYLDENNPSKNKDKAISYFKTALFKFDKFGSCGSANTIKTLLISLGVDEKELPIKCKEK